MAIAVDRGSEDGRDGVHLDGVLAVRVGGVRAVAVPFRVDLFFDAVYVYFAFRLRREKEA